MQERRNSIANALELRLSCTNTSICASTFFIQSHQILKQAAGVDPSGQVAPGNVFVAKMDGNVGPCLQ